jgi:hypothetical protein
MKIAEMKWGVDLLNDSVDRIRQHLNPIGGQASLTGARREQ